MAPCGNFLRSLVESAFFGSRYHDTFDVTPQKKPVASVETATDLLARRKLVMQEVYRPDLI
jgi:hypothetical protein